jgi:twitching motility protein PilT
MVRADGDALVMHVGERPIVVSGPKTIDLSTHGMNLGAMVGMLGQLLSGEAMASLKEFGAVEHALPSRGTDYFSVVAARSGDDIWIEIRRRRDAPVAAETAPVAMAPVAVEPAPATSTDESAVGTAEPPARPIEEASDTPLPAGPPVPARVEAEPSAGHEPEAALAGQPAASVSAEPDTAVASAPVAAVEPEPVAAAEPEPIAAVEPEPAEAELSAAVESAAPVDAALEASPAAELGAAVVAEVDARSATRPEAQAVVEPEPDVVVASPEAVAAVSHEPLAVAESEPPTADEPEPLATAEPEPSIAVDQPAQILAEEPAREAEPAPLSHDLREPREEADAPDTLVHVAAVAGLDGTAAEHASGIPLAETALEPEPEIEPQPEPVAVVAEPIEEITAVDVATPAASADTTPETSSHEELPAVPVMASAGVSAYPASTLTTGVPMDPARHLGSSADGPPSRPAESPASPTGASSGAGTEDAVATPGGPVTRTVRIEVPPRAASSRTAGIDRLLRAADALGASELFLVSQARPYVRVGGNVRALQDEAPLLPADIEALIADVTPEPWRDAVRRGDPAEWLIELVDVGRVRCSTFRDHRGPGANFHFAFLRATTADDLQLNADTRLLATEPDGLVLVAGGPGSDVSAIVAAFVGILNHQRADYVIALEPQVRVQHVNREALVSQREVGHDPSRMAVAARAALRESPDVLVIEGVASGEVAQIAIEAATQDRLVIASIDAPSAPAAVQRLVELVPAEQQKAARAHLARCFRGAVAQLLLRKTTGGRIAARELMIGTRTLARRIADGDLARLAGPTDAAGAAGPVTLADTIVEYVRSGLVDVREAVRKAPDTEDLIARLEAAGVNLHALDRWN